MTITQPALPVFDFYELVTMPDPYPQYAEWRAAGPLIKGGPGQWGVTRHAEVAALLKDRRLSHTMPEEYTQFVMGSGPSSEFRQNSLLMKDGPPHRRLRQLVSRAFTPKLVRQLQDRVAALVDTLVEPLLDGAVLDLAENLAFPLPVAVICELMGIGPEDRDDVRDQTAKVFGPDHEASDLAVTWLRSHMEGVLAHRRPDPDGDLLERMLAAREGEDAFSHQEIVDNAVLLFFGGFETTRYVIATGAVALSRQPEQFRTLRSAHDTPVRAVEELLRFDSPVRSISTMATEPVEVGDRVVKAGHVLYLLLGSANHDASVFAEPEQLDLLRSPNPHVTFGGGTHRCLGMHLARLEVEVVLRRLAASFDALEPAGMPSRSGAAFGAAYTSAPVRALARNRGMLEEWGTPSL